MQDLDSIKEQWLYNVTDRWLGSDLLRTLMAFTISPVDDDTDLENAQAWVVTVNETMDANFTDEDIRRIAKVLSLRPAPRKGIFLVSCDVGEDGRAVVDKQSLHFNLESAFRACAVHLFSGMTENEWVHLLLDNQTEIRNDIVLTEMKEGHTWITVRPPYAPAVPAKRWYVDTELLIAYMRRYEMTPAQLLEMARDEQKAMNGCLLLSTVCRPYNK
jgi:hypothetical protein